MEPSVLSTAAVRVEDAGLAAISLASRVPEFSTDKPRAWFIQLEATLAPQNLSDHAKYDLVVSRVSKKVILQITDILINPPEEGKYTTLKNRLLSIFEESQNRQIQKLIGEMELGDQRPSQLLRCMRDLARNKINDEILTVLWQNILPTTVRGILAVIETKDLDKLATIADKVLESSGNGHIMEFTPSSSSSSNLAAEISRLTQSIAYLERGCSTSRKRDFLRSHSRSGGQRRNPKHQLCYYHDRYKAKANKCVQPCAWKNRQEPAQA